MTSTLTPRFWFAARTRYQQERLVCDRLAALGIEYYAPFRTEQRQWSDRVKTIEVPLIPSLVFLRAGYEEASSLLSDSQLPIRYMQNFATNERLVVPDRQMEQFQRITRLYAEGLTLFNDQLKPGCRVRVLEGAFKGIEGELIRIKGHKRVVVRLDGLFAMATTYIPGEYLEQIG